MGWGMGRDGWVMGGGRKISEKFPRNFPEFSGDPKTGKSYCGTGKQNFDVWPAGEEFYDHP